MKIDVRLRCALVYFLHVTNLPEGSPCRVSRHVNCCREGVNYLVRTYDWSVSRSGLFSGERFCSPRRGQRLASVALINLDIFFWMGVTSLLKHSSHTVTSKDQSSCRKLVILLRLVCQRATFQEDYLPDGGAGSQKNNNDGAALRRGFLITRPWAINQGANLASISQPVLTTCRPFVYYTPLPEIEWTLSLEILNCSGFGWEWLEITAFDVNNVGLSALCEMVRRTNSPRVRKRFYLSIIKYFISFGINLCKSGCNCCFVLCKIITHCHQARKEDVVNIYMLCAKEFGSLFTFNVSKLDYVDHFWN